MGNAFTSTSAGSPGSMIGYTNTSEFATYAQGILRQYNTQFNAYEQAQANKSLEAAWGYIQARLRSRGMTEVQVAAWQMGMHYQERLALYYLVLSLGAQSTNAETEWHKEYDCRKEIDSAPIAADDGTVEDEGAVAEVIDLCEANHNLGIYR